MNKRLALKVLLGAAVLAGAIGILVRLNAVVLPQGPVSIAWDREACAHCHMHIGDPAFAAQLQLRDGRVLNFDDPGCLFAELPRHLQDVHAVYFRDHASDRWLSRDEVAFVPTEQSPMGYGIAAVEKNTANTRDWSWAQAKVTTAKGGGI